MVAREPHVVPDNENVKRAERKMFRKRLAAKGYARRPDVLLNIIPGGAEILLIARDGSDDGFDRNMKCCRNAPDAQRIAIRAVFQGADFAGGETAGYGKLFDRVSGEIARGEDLFGKRSIGFVIGIGL
ncbi:hypothetical protein N5D47_20575 [Agrobacterium sp. GD03871]|nr:MULTISPECIES: hypothetical protein [unclassified Agrobacterium]MDH0614958.1 hypothetical protein [Agrobacterium sp. GD03872]MDH0698589.1 hypothetical protein [Agrobacterium sp. GD03871]MDH1062020.1 hypothetical protein [Agrobacterium sp. GD03992]MDH2211728.1 hypothetical protein [Agrobacterium sp. GD03643]MDH2220420.1 hypothetical protein [Agrobacterium sp. GD03638]